MVHAILTYSKHFRDGSRHLEDDLNCCPPCEPSDIKPSNYVVTSPTLPNPGLIMQPVRSEGSLSSTKPAVSESIRDRASEASLTSKTYTPSSLSSASRTSNPRHALLKPSVTETRPLDIGLPVPPMLSPIPIPAIMQRSTTPNTVKAEEKGANITANGEPANQRAATNVINDTNSATDILPINVSDQVAGGIAHTGNESSTPEKKDERPVPSAPGFDRLSDLQKARELVESMRGHIKLMEDQIAKAIVEPTDHISQRNNDFGGLKPMEETSSALKKGKRALLSPKSHRLEDCASFIEGESLLANLPPASNIPIQDPTKIEAEQNHLSHEGQEIVEGRNSFKEAIEVPEHKVSKIDKASPDHAVQTTANAKAIADGDIQAGMIQPSSSPNEAYWGFSPTAKQAVQGAVDLAVRNAVQKIALPTGPTEDEAVDTYRRLLAESLAQAAQRADDSLLNASLGTPSPSQVHKNPEGTVIFTSHPSRVDHSPSSVKVPVALRDRNKKRNSRQSNAIGKNQENQVLLTVEALEGKYGQNGDVPSNFESHEDLTVLPGELETISLESHVKFDSRENTPGWHLSNAFKKGYTPIPTRNSSKNRALGPKTSATNSMSQFSPNSTLDSLAEKRPFERPVSETRRNDRSISSAGSLTSAGMEMLDHTKKLLPSIARSPPDNGPKPMTALPESRAPTRKSTVNWLRELIPSNTAYETRFTASPPRSRTDYKALESPTAPTGQAGDLNVGDFPNPIINKPTTPKSKREKRIDPSETFSKTITDLENLMTKALLIARQATDNQNSAYAPTLLENAAQVLKGGRKLATDANSKDPLGNENYKNHAVRPCEDCSDPSVHESLMEDSAVSVLDSDSPDEEERPHEIKQMSSSHASNPVLGQQKVRDYVERNYQPMSPKSKSPNLRQQADNLHTSSDAKFAPGKTHEPLLVDETRATSTGHDLVEHVMDRDRHGYSHSLDGSLADRSEVPEFDDGLGARQRSASQPGGISPLHGAGLQDRPGSNLPHTIQPLQEKKKDLFSLEGKRHVNLRGHHGKGFSFTRSHKRQTIARDWSPLRKRLVATVACISTALTGILVGIYAGETPAIQYYIVDFHHYIVLGNVFFFIGLSIPTLLFWPLPLLHGRKPYILGAFSLAMPLLFPQALAVEQFRSPYVAKWRVALILPRAFMGFCLGFANMNFLAMLTDLFGASLQSRHPHEEHVDEFDVRRHGGGMGAWLGLWTWCSIGSIGFGFMIGAVIINTLPPAWGFVVSICIIAFIMLLNVLCPEVRRSAFRRSVAEVINKEAEVIRRLARGEVKMHMVQSGPNWWGEEFHHGILLSKKMLRQPGFLVMALYTAWMYGQMVLIISLLGSLMSRDYGFKSPYVGASVTALPAGALLAIPFEKASFFSRARSRIIKSDDDTLKKGLNWTSHMLRRCIFILCLPLVSLAYTLTSGGPPMPFYWPIIFSALFGFLSSLASSECSGIMMENFDTSDLQPGMTGRRRSSAGDKSAAKRTNYSSFPRVQSAFAMCQGFGYLIAAAASGLGGSLTRRVGQQAATGVMAGILFVLSVLLLGVLIRFKDVQIIPDSKKGEMEQYHEARRLSTIRRNSGISEEEPWRPIIIGNPHHVTRRMSLLELGSMSRFSEIRRKNKLIDAKSLEAQHPNRAALEDVRQYVQALEHELRRKANESLNR